MEIRVLGCYGGADSSHRLTSFLVDGTIAIDAGSITSALTLEEQLALTDIFLSHSHLDHTSSLPFLVDNIFGLRDKPLRVHAPPELLGIMRTNIFNEAVWPDFTKLPSLERPTLQYVETPVGKPFKLGHLQVTAVYVNHVVRTTGVIVSDNGKSWIYSSDTADTEEIWRVVNGLPAPSLLFLECSYPNRLAALADASLHLTPNGVASQLAKLNRQIPTRIYHPKPIYLEEIREELSTIDHPDLELLQQGQVFTV
jgi:ribonuclease BN (tRNA processing enzyme)